MTSYTEDDLKVLGQIRNLSTKEITTFCRLAPEVLWRRAKEHRESAIEAQNAYDAMTIHPANT